jgi:small nuclear ribonucleoprotein (snRNP)-like protein
LEELKDQPVWVATVTGKQYAGTLIGVDVYDIIIRQAKGLEILFPKGNIVYVHRRTEGEA